MSLDTLLDNLEQVTSETSKNKPGLPDNSLQNKMVTRVTPVTSKQIESAQNLGITPEQRKIIQVEERRQKILSLLADNPDKQRVYITDDKTDPGNIILTVAIRNLASFEMLIPKSKYDPFLLIELINKPSLQ